MAALAAVNTLASAAAPKVRASVDDGDAGRFGEMYSRELNKPAEVARPQERQRHDDPAQAASETDASTSEEIPAQAASVLDPLLASLQQAFTPQLAQMTLPQQSKELKTDDPGQEKNPLLAALLPGGLPQNVTGAATPLVSPESVAQAAGNNLPVLADVSAKSALVTTESTDLLSNMASGQDLDFDEALQGSLLLKSNAPHAQELAPASARSDSAQAVARHAVAEPVGDSRWGEAVAQRVSLMLGRQEQKLEMQLNPPNLGPMEVRLSLGGEQASVVFASQHAGVREALAAATPRLTALLADQGIVLTNVQVASDSLSQQQFQQGYQQQDEQKRTGSAVSVLDNADAEVQVRELGSIRVPVARSGVSLYV